MTDHELDAGPDTVSDVLSAERPPVLTVSPGDRVTVRTLDCAGNLEPARTRAGRRPLIEGSRGHCLVGPIVVDGATPGQVLAIRLEALTPDAWGFTAAGGHGNSDGRVDLNRALGVEDAEPAHVFWEIDGDTATTGHGLAVDLHPFLGVIGLPPEATGEHSTIPPRTRGAGNIDCKELVAGSTLFVPVTVDGAHLFVGDGHAAQGDGEVGGTAIETGMTTTLTLDLRDEAPTDGVHATAPAGLITFGFDADLNRAAAEALAAMLTWMQTLSGLDRTTTLALASTVVDLRVTQVANRAWGVHALLPARFAEQLTRTGSSA
ncbi:acetamidase/formamidase family protein [Jatrophihabitans endophyticus]|uniref:acetamidase/formamidase family protein n=1 Tax=Jatrophihabitans endophyticus TaxID=1206085 RepID=UPI001A006C59|nr:acetamidase/formamidase family protein [Jatrophihabitans endophyticus]MBE7187610.1 acetamidase/formamidase family protein [Jatrophihabitans endophyticus]